MPHSFGLVLNRSKDLRKLLLQFSFHEILPLKIIPPCGRHLRSASWCAVWFPHFFSFWPLRAAAYRSKGVMKNEYLTLPPSRAFMDDITILVPFKIAADGLLQRYYDLFTWARIKAKPKKSRSLSLVGGSVREIHFEIGGDKISTVREKPVKSLGRVYSIQLTDRYRDTEV